MGNRHRDNGSRKLENYGCDSILPWRTSSLKASDCLNDPKGSGGQESQGVLLRPWRRSQCWWEVNIKASRPSLSLQILKMKNSFIASTSIQGSETGELLGPKRELWSGDDFLPRTVLVRFHSLAAELPEPATVPETKVRAEQWPSLLTIWDVYIYWTGPAFSGRFPGVAEFRPYGFRTSELGRKDEMNEFRNQLRRPAFRALRCA